MTEPYPNVPASYGLAKMRMSLDGALHDPYVIWGYHHADDSESAQDHANTIFGDFAALHDSLWNGLTFQQLTVVENRNGTVVEAGSTLTPVAGSVSSTPVPPNTSILVHKATNRIGRHYHGRMYLPGATHAILGDASDQLHAENVAAMTTELQGILSNMANDGLAMVLLHRDAEIPPTTVNQVWVEARLATQSRRLRKVPRH